MLELVGRPVRELDLVSPYFVPTAGGTAVLQELARGGSSQTRSPRPT